MYSRNFIIKGGYLIGEIVGLDLRTTMDLDATVKGFELSPENLTLIIKEIIEIHTDESFSLIFDSVKEIRETDNYPGYRIKLHATFEQLNEVVTIDLTFGDAITPKATGYYFKRLFEDSYIELLSYPIETILAEKLETILSRGIGITRPRDYYDVYLISKLQSPHFSVKLLKEALIRTMKKRNSTFNIAEYQLIMKEIKESQFQRSLYTKYQKQFDYVNKTTYDDVISTILNLIHDLMMIEDE